MYWNLPVDDILSFFFFFTHSMWMSQMMRIRGGTRLQTTLPLILSQNHLLITVRHPPPRLSFSSSPLPPPSPLSTFSSSYSFVFTVSIAKQWVTQASLKKQYDVIAVYTLSPFLFSGTSEMVEQIPHYKKVSYQSTFHLLQNWYVCVCGVRMYAES